MRKGKIHFWSAILILIALNACTTVDRSRRVKKSAPPSAGQNQGSENTQTDQRDGDDIEEFQEAVVRPKTLEVPKVGVILGPGMALSLSHAGVLKAFDEAKIPIEQVVGLGWGSVVGALYAKQGMANDAQWRIYKLKDSDLPGKSFFSSSVKSESVQSMAAFLKDGLGSDLVNRTKVGFSCPAMSLKSGKTFWQMRGAMVDAVSRCISFPPLFTPVSENVVGDLYATQQAVQYLKQRGIGLIIFVDVLHNGELLPQQMRSENFASVILWQQIRKHSNKSYAMMNEVITVKTGPFGLMDFKQKQALVQRGEVAGRAAVQKIVKKYGF